MHPPRSRRQLQQNGIYMYDDYMYRGGYMAGMEMGLMFGIMGASNYAYMDPMCVDDYGGMGSTPTRTTILETWAGLNARAVMGLIHKLDCAI